LSGKHVKTLDERLRDFAMGKIKCHVLFLLAAIFVSAAICPQSATAAQRHSFRWWASDEVKQKLELTDTQTQEIENIFQTLRPKLRELSQALKKEEKQLTNLMHAMQAEEWEVTLQIDRVESARGALSKTRILMLYRMHKKLSATQLEGLHDLWEHRRSRGDARTRHRR
jgi:Spy/CpxP family protein refolding chaperone